MADPAQPITIHQISLSSLPSIAASRLLLFPPTTRAPSSSTRAHYLHHPSHLPLPSCPPAMSVTQKAAATLVRHTARQQVPALRQSAAIQQARTRADASTTTNASFKSPFHRGESSHQDTTVIPSFKKYRAGSEASNKMFSYFMVGAFGGLSALGAKDTVQSMSLDTPLMSTHTSGCGHNTAHNVMWTRCLPID